MSNTPAEDKSFTIILGKDVIVCLPPRLPLEYALDRAWRRAMGFTEDDDRRLANLADGEPVPGPSGEGSADDLTAVCIATVAAWYPRPLPGLPAFHAEAIKRDAVLWGETAYGCFPAEQRAGLVEAGQRLLGEMQRRRAAEYHATQAIKGE